MKWLALYMQLLNLLIAIAMIRKKNIDNVLLLYLMPSIVLNFLVILC